MSATRCAAGQTPSPKSGSTRSRNPWRGTPIRMICTCRGLFSASSTCLQLTIQTHAQQAKEMQDDPAWVETYGQHFSWHEYWSWAKKPGTHGTFANISSLPPHARHFRRCVRPRGRCTKVCFLIQLEIS